MLREEETRRLRRRFMTSFLSGMPIKTPSRHPTLAVGCLRLHRQTGLLSLLLKPRLARSWILFNRVIKISTRPWTSLLSGGLLFKRAVRASQLRAYRKSPSLQPGGGRLSHEMLLHLCQVVADAGPCSSVTCESHPPERQTVMPAVRSLRSEGEGTEGCTRIKQVS